MMWHAWRKAIIPRVATKFPGRNSAPRCKRNMPLIDKSMWGACLWSTHANAFKQCGLSFWFLRFYPKVVQLTFSKCQLATENPCHQVSPATGWSSAFWFLEPSDSLICGCFIGVMANHHSQCCASSKVPFAVVACKAKETGQPGPILGWSLPSPWDLAGAEQPAAGTKCALAPASCQQILTLPKPGNWLRKTIHKTNH